MIHHGVGPTEGVPCLIQALSYPRPSEEPGFCSMHVMNCWVSAPLEGRAHIAGDVSSARSKYPLGPDI